MATTVITGNKRTEFESIVRTWESRYRQARLLLWLPRAFTAALMTGILVLLITRLTGLLAPQPALIAAGLSMGISASVCLGLILRPRSLMVAVRHFEKQFDLREKLATALELLGGRIHTFEDMAAHQLEDAYTHVRRVNAKEAMPLEVRWREWLALIPLVMAFVVAALFLSSGGVGAGISAATEQAVDAAADNLRDITESVANNTALTPEERQALLETLETSMDTLTDKPLSSEEAFASLQDVEQSLRNQATQMRNNARTQQEAFDATAQILNDVVQSGNTGETGEGIEELNSAFQQMMENMSNLSDEQRQQMMDALNRAGQQMMPASPEMAEALQNAANAMQQGDNSAASQALQQAMDQAQQSQSNMQSQNQSAQSLEDAAQQAQNSARNVAESEQQDNQQQSDSDQQNQSGEQENQDSQSGEGSQQANGDSASQQTENQGGSESSSDESGQNSGQTDSGSQGDAAAPAEGMESAEGDPNGSPSTGASAGGAGDNPSSSQAQPGGSGETTTNNNPDGEGESEYDPIYAPQHITSEGTTDMVLEPDTGNVPVTEGNFQNNPAGQSVVPYNQVFQNYADAASQSLNSDYIPLSLRDVVQDYFTGLEPKR